MTRVAGFEIMPAPYVIAHWQVGHALRAARARRSATNERAAVYLTNALTGWAAPREPEAADAAQRGLRYTYPPLADERDEAARVKQVRPILVVLGNPPYNAFAGTSPAEESGLVEPYKEGLQRDWGIRKFNLDDLYVRFFRIAERRIAEGTGRGVVCFISNHSWLSYPSFVVMRQRLLAEFDRIWIDNLNGSKFETGKRGAGRQTSETVCRSDPRPIARESRSGTAVALLVEARSRRRTVGSVQRSRDASEAERSDAGSCLESLDAADFDGQYVSTRPRLPIAFRCGRRHRSSGLSDRGRRCRELAASPHSRRCWKSGGKL